jgi:hypothetical protein
MVRFAPGDCHPVEILFSQGPTTHSRLANSLLWMARAYPELCQIGDCNYIFPWGREVFQEYLDPQSPWLTNASTQAEELFSRVAGTPLTSQSLATLSRELEAAYEAREGLAPYGWPSLSLRHSINGVDLAYIVGADLPFQAMIEQVQGAELVVIHEPYQLRYAGPLYPEHGLEHVSPNPCLVEDARQYIATVNPESVNMAGLHVRRGDYAIWEQGKFYYDDQFWLDLCEQKRGESQQVCVFTNDPGDDVCQKLAALGAHVSVGSPAQDMVRMMHMDAIHGPPSTFPLMAKNLAKCCLQRNIVYQMLGPK